MQVVATDGGTPARSASTVVCVDVLNENDNSPVFSTDVFPASVSDGDAPGVFVTQIKATDLDADSAIRYDFVTTNNYFQIDAISGNVTVSTTINRADILTANPNSQVDITVRASDGDKSTTAFLRITIVATNRFPPKFTETVYTSDVNEGVSGVQVIQVSASDDDNPQEVITYSIHNSTLPNIFTIDPSRGEVRLVQALDREALPAGFVEAVIVARDSGNPLPQRTATATLRLEVNDLNDNVPQFDKDSHDLDIFQNFTSGQSFGLPKATDKDVSDTIVYELSDNAKQFFTLDPTSGVVTTRTDCDASCRKLEDCHEMTFTLSAYNPGTPLQKDTLTVRLTLLSLGTTRTPAAGMKSCSDANSPNDHDPKFTEDNYDGTVNEGVPPNTVVLIVNTTDEDWGNSGKVTYTITNSTRFGIDDDGQIYTTGDLDYEKPEDRRTCMQVVATDGGTPARSASTVVCVDLINSNDHRPKFVRPLFTAVINDGALPGTFVTTISATDKDADSQITYDFALPNDYFQIDPASGNVTVSKTIVRSEILLTDPKALITVQVRANDGKFLEITQLMVTVLEVNRFAPEFNQTIYNAAVDEGISNVVVGQVTANDRDVPKQQITYSIYNSTIPNIFTIDPSSGEVRLVQALDREALPVGFVEVVIMARDSGNPPPQRTATATLRLQVNDVNDNVPQFDEDSHDLDIFQNFTSGQSFVLPKATDKDVSDTIVYELSDNAKQFFTLDPTSGVVTTRTDCDASCKKLADCNYMTFTLWAYNPDAQDRRDSLTVRLTLLALTNTRTPATDIKSCSDTNSPNNHDPKFTKDNYEGTVDEGVPPNTVVITVNTTDEDWGDSGKVTYTITNSTRFGIDDDGQIYTTGDLDYEKPEDRRTCMQVVATDGGTPARSASTVVCVDLINSNDHRPKFVRPLFTAVINDGALPGTFVTTISATDKDADSQITYDFVLPNDYFQIDPASGNVTVSKTIVRSEILLTDPKALITVQVRANDGKFLEITQLMVTVLEVNRFAPEFNQTIYNAAVDEGISNVVVGQVTANDRDVPKQQITYSIYNSTIPNIFTIDPSSGEVRLVQALDREALPVGFVEVVIMARDSGNPPPQRTATATLRLQVNDVNDNVPQFDKDSHDLDIFQNFTSGQSFVLPKATDKDVSDTIVYELSDNAKQFFTLDPTSGVVTTRTDCDASCKKLADCNYMTFTLWAYNPDAQDRRDSLTVRLTLLALTNTRTPATDIKSCSDTNSPNNHDPKFTEDNYDGTVNEGVPPNTVVITVNTTDEDWGDSGKVTYTITNSTRFGIDDDGQIYTTGDLDYEKPEDRRTCMQVVATDGGTPARSASTVVCVDLINSNDHRPKFVRPLFTAVINDGALPGTFVTTISATDKDADSQITYDFVLPNDYFQIDPASGNVTVSKTIVRSEILLTYPKALITVQVRANDGKFLEITQLMVTVLEVNRFAPEFNQTIYNAAVDEGISNVVVGQVTANDRDVPKQQITYSIYNSTIPNIFTVDPSSGEVRLVQALDREALPVGFVEVVIMARDSGNPPPQRTATATLRLQVNDVNDNVPQFDKDSHDLDIFQNFTSGQSFVLPKATDKDVSDTIVYELSDNAKQFFTLDPTSGVVTTRTDCDASCKKLADCNYMTFTVWAYNPDAQDRRDSLTVRLTLLALTNTRTPATDIKSCSDTNSPNNHDPKFTKDNYEGTVDEGVPPNTVVITVNTTDEDWGNSGKVTYTITNSTRFGIDDDGQIYTTGDLDYEKPEDRRTCMQVVATDGGTPARSASTVVCVDVRNKNEHTPTFTRPTFSTFVYDRDAPGTFVIQILATDRDSGATVRHTLVPGTSEYFQIDAISGNITVKKTINRDAMLQNTGADFVTLTVRATDGVLDSTAQLRVTVVKKNDFAPEFGQEVFPVTVIEETVVDPLITVTATDRDSINEIVTYRIVNVTSLVSIDSSTGVIRLHRAIDRESLGGDGIVDIVVEAKDSGRPPSLPLSNRHC
ncbi:protocadherin Fat 4-like [Liolophura sinensis]|uniref:protocadherin Fat 4-like n=1 Tax=Liolophura sinensis TaxID=3198878 RepID=UPI0031589E96